MSKRKQTNFKHKIIDTSNFDTSVRPQDDFYRYVNGGWFKKNSIPPDRNSWGHMDVISEKNLKQLHTILRDLQKQKNLSGRSNSGKARNLYLSALDMKKRNRQKTTYLEDCFLKIEALRKKEDLTELLAYLHCRGVDAPWSLWFDQDDKNSTRMVMRIASGGIGVPDRDYYVQNTKEAKRIKDAYQKYITRTLKLEDFYQKRDIPTNVHSIMRIEKKLAHASLTATERRNVHKLYNKVGPKDLAHICPSIDWKSYFELLGIPMKAQQHIILDEPKFLKEVHALITRSPLRDLRTYLHWHLLDTYTGTLGQAYLDASFAYHGRALSGLKKPTEPWKRAVRIVNGLLPDILGRLYAKKHFPPSSKKKITEIAENIKQAYRERITALDWMSSATKKKALQKLSAMTLMLGYPPKWQSYTKLHLDTESFTKNILNANIFGFIVEVDKLSKPTDPDEMICSAATVNAFYSPNLNQMTFPAGILQPVLFDATADDAVNYGAIGAVIGHEMTHGFDDSGAQFDKKGNLNEWWSDTDKKRFARKTRGLAKQYDSYHVFEGIHVNGKLTLGENIADLGGVVLAYDAFRATQKNKKTPQIDTLSPEERFFISFAQAEGRLMRDEFLKLITLTDPHSPHEFRVNGVVVNTDAFHETFNVKKDDGLYKHPRSRIQIW